MRDVGKRREGNLWELGAEGGNKAGKGGFTNGRGWGEFNKLQTGTWSSHMMWTHSNSAVHVAILSCPRLDLDSVWLWGLFPGDIQTLPGCGSPCSGCPWWSRGWVKWTQRALPASAILGFCVTLSCSGGTDK